MPTTRQLDRLAEATLRSIAEMLVSEDHLESEISKYKLVVSFLRVNPDSYSSRSRTKPQIGSVDFVERTASRFFAERMSRTEPSLPTTVPDTVVALVLTAHFGYPKSDIAKIEKDHQAAMAAENIVGKLLERYIAEHLEPHGWTWCAGDFVKAVDFLLPLNGGKWEVLQVKNRDNSENSSSSAIRQGTDIKKWFRTYSQTGKSNWSQFPGSDKEYGVSEEGFRSFVLNYFKKSK